MIVSALSKMHLAQGFPPNPHIEAVMHDLSTSKHINVQQRCLEYRALREVYTALPNEGKGIFDGTPINEEQVQMENMDLDLTFLSAFVEGQKSQGLPEYDPSRSLTAGNANAAQGSTLKFTAYKQEHPSFSRTSDASGSNPVDKTSGFAPVTVTQSSAEANANLTLNVKSKQVWGMDSADAAEESTKKAEPVNESTTSAATGASSNIGSLSSR